MKENLKITLYLLAIFVLYGIAGRLDYDSQVAEARPVHIITAQVQQ